MRNENSDILEVCVGVNEEGGKVLIGERFRKKDGRIPVRWHVDPKTSETSLKQGISILNQCGSSIQISDWTGQGHGRILMTGGPDVLPLAPPCRSRSEHGPVLPGRGVAPDLFGEIIVERRWGRIGGRGQCRAASYATINLAEAAASRLIGAKERRGYRRPT